MLLRNPAAIIRMKANDILLFYIADGGIKHFLPFKQIVNPRWISLLCCRWHYQLVATFNNERVNIIVFKTISPWKMILQHLINPRISVQLVHYAGLVSTYFKTSKYLVLVWPGYDLLIRLPMKNVTFPLLRMYELRPLLLCSEEKRLSVHSLYYNQSGAASSPWMEMLKVQMYWKWRGRWKAKPLKQ